MSIVCTIPGAGHTVADKTDLVLLLWWLQSSAVVPKLQYAPVYKDRLRKQSEPDLPSFSGDVGVVFPSITL